MATEPTGAHAPFHAPFGRSQFFGIRLSRDPDEAYAAVSRILADRRARPDVALAQCSDWIDGHGVESVELADGAELLYVNAGDTYDATLCYLPLHGFFVSSYGDEVEAAEQQRTRSTGERRCGYCGSWNRSRPSCGGCGRDPLTGEPLPEPLRRVRLDTGHVLTTWDAANLQRPGPTERARIGYELRDESGNVLFSGSDFGPPPLYAIDSDDTLRALLGFLTLRPGDTDADYFDDHSEAQLAFIDTTDCETLACLYGPDGEGNFADIEEPNGRADA
ncbi:MAG: hypothetical protein KAI24_11005 [Planctomycetes bacterium]|nr:hypothetical protein [Planctomycetota bacterium]